LEVPVAQKLYVGNLSFNMTEDSLKDAFSPYGEVQSVKIIMDRDTGRSRGFGFVEMDNADSALEALNGTDLDGRNIRVSIAREREQRDRRPGGGGGFQGRGRGGGFNRGRSDGGGWGGR